MRITEAAELDKILSGVNPYSESRKAIKKMAKEDRLMYQTMRLITRNTSKKAHNISGLSHGRVVNSMRNKEPWEILEQIKRAIRLGYIECVARENKSNGMLFVYYKVTSQGLYILSTI